MDYVEGFCHDSFIAYGCDLQAPHVQQMHSGFVPVGTKTIRTGLDFFLYGLYLQLLKQNVQSL